MKKPGVNLLALKNGLRVFRIRSVLWPCILVLLHFQTCKWQIPLYFCLEIQSLHWKRNVGLPPPCSSFLYTITLASLEIGTKSAQFYVKQQQNLNECFKMFNWLQGCLRLKISILNTKFTFPESACYNSFNGAPKSETLSCVLEYVKIILRSSQILLFWQLIWPPIFFYCAITIQWMHLINKHTHITEVNWFSFGSLKQHQ